MTEGWMEFKERKEQKHRQPPQQTARVDGWAVSVVCYCGSRTTAVDQRRLADAI